MLGALGEHRVEDVLAALGHRIRVVPDLSAAGQQQRGRAAAAATHGGKYNARMALLSGKKILVTGLLSNRSIAYGIAKSARREGAELAFTYVGERFKERVTDLARDFGSDARATPATSRATPRSPRCSSRCARAGAAWTAWCTPSASRRARRSRASSSTACRARRSASRTTSPPTASPRWPRRRCR